EAGEVRREQAELALQGLQRQPPVGPRAHPRAGAVQQQHRLAAAKVVVVGQDRAALDLLADLGVGGGRVHASPPALRHTRRTVRACGVPSSMRAVSAMVPSSFLTSRRFCSPPTQFGNMLMFTLWLTTSPS